MSRVSSLVVAIVGLGIAASVMGCQVEASIKTKTRYITTVAREDAAAWAGQPISIDIAGVGFASNGGVSVTADPNATTVTATARLLAMALETEKANAELSMEEAKNTFTLTSDGSSIKIVCGHGGTHGSSNGGESGCEKVDIVVPAGSAQTPLELKVLSGNGEVNLQLANATLKGLGTNAHGLTDAILPATQGATISLVGEQGDDIKVSLPSDFAADEVIVQADADKISLGPFSEIKNGQGAGGYGTAGTGLASLKLTSKEFAGSTGEVSFSSR